MNKNQVNAMMTSKIDDNFNLLNTQLNGLMANPDYSINQTLNQTLSCWGYWRDYYYPTIIRDSYPVYIQERAKDKGKQAFEIINMLKDKKFLKLEAVGDFIDVMDELIKIL